MGEGSDDSTPKVPRLARAMMKLEDMVMGPVDWVKHSVVEPMRSKNKQYYYHRKMRRVPTVDECYTDDFPCIFEAEEQFKRDKKVDANILNILRQRKMECMFYYGPDADTKCTKVTEDYELAAANHFAKYGDLGALPRVIQAYMKQKHQMLWERRHKMSLVTGQPIDLQED